MKKGPQTRPRVQRVPRRKVLKIDRPWAGGFLSLTGPAGPRVVVAAYGHACGVRVQRVQRVQKVQRGKVLKIDRLRAGGFLGLTGPAGPRVVVAAAPQF